MNNQTYTGHYSKGTGRASGHLASYDADFNCRMVGTFNIRLLRPFDAVEGLRTRERSYWLLTVSNGPESPRLCWATRDHGSSQPDRLIEILSKAPLPDSFKTGRLQVTAWHPWGEPGARSWADGQYWFQTWPWTPTVKADSQFVWDKMAGQAEWSGKQVLDIGGNAGFHAFRAAHAGARVTVVEPSLETRQQGETIARHIERQDVEFVSGDPGGEWDVILYLSVHHQIDPEYSALADTLAALRARAPTVFVELHVEPQGGDMPADPFRHYTCESLNGLFSRQLARYQSNVRGVRALYRL